MAIFGLLLLYWTYSAVQFMAAGSWFLGVLMLVMLGVLMLSEKRQ